MLWMKPSGSRWNAASQGNPGVCAALIEGGPYTAFNSHAAHNNAGSTPTSEVKGNPS
jgi:hypothetical protein